MTTSCVIKLWNFHQNIRGKYVPSCIFVITSLYVGIFQIVLCNSATEINHHYFFFCSVSSVSSVLLMVSANNEGFCLSDSKISSGCRFYTYYHESCKCVHRYWLSSSLSSIEIKNYDVTSSHHLFEYVLCAKFDIFFIQ